MKGGSYQLKNGKRVLVSRTEQLEERKAREAREAEDKAKADAKATKSTSDKEG